VGISSRRRSLTRLGGVSSGFCRSSGLLQYRLARRRKTRFARRRCGRSWRSIRCVERLWWRAVQWMHATPRGRRVSSGELPHGSTPPVVGALGRHQHAVRQHQISHAYSIDASPHQIGRAHMSCRSDHAISSAILYGTPRKTCCSLRTRL
jgi:hypothetical protein